MTDPTAPPSAPRPPGTVPNDYDRLLSDLFGVVNRLGVRRVPRSQAWVGGVCGGLARRYRIDPVVIRVGVIVLTMLSGAGLVVYVLAWLLLPAPDGPGILATESTKSPGRIVTGIVLAAGGLLLIGGIVNTLIGGGLVGGSSAISPVVLVGMVAAVVFLAARRRGQPPYAGSPTAQATGQPPSAGSLTAQVTGPTTRLAEPTARLGGPVVAAPRRPRPRRRRLSPSVALTLSGLSLVLGVALAALHPRQQWPGDPRTIALAGALGLVAVVLLIGGLLGRKGGLTTLLALVLTLGLGASAAASDPLWSSGGGDRVLTLAPGTTSASTRLALGTVAIDLTRLAAEASPTPHQASTQLGLGEVTIRLPRTGSVRVDSRILLGQILVGEVPEKGQSVRNVDYHQTFGTGPLVAVVSVDVRAGVVKIVGSAP